MSNAGKAVLGTLVMVAIFMVPLNGLIGWGAFAVAAYLLVDAFNTKGETR